MQSIVDKLLSPVSLFYSYAAADELLCSELEKHLAALRREGHIAEWRRCQIIAGNESVATIERYLTTAQIILLLISADYLASDHCYSVEMQQALQRHHSGNARVIPVILRPVDWQHAPFAHLSCLPHNAMPVTLWENLDDAFVDIAKGLREVLEELHSTPHFRQSQAISPVRAYPSIWLVPYHRNSLFTGREDDLAHLHEDLTHGSAVALTQPRALSGLGGIGKTQTANEYAHRYADEYTAVFWVRAEERELLSSDYAQIATYLRLPPSNKHDREEINKEITEEVKQWLSTHDNWLLIFDNIEDLQLIRDFTPTRHQGHILLTTRVQVTEPIASALVLEKMPEIEAIFFVLRRAKLIALEETLEQASERDRQLANSIWSEMDGLALALDQAAAYVLETGSSLSHYLDLFRQRKAELLALRGQFDSDHPASVTTTFSLIFDKIKRKNPTAADLLKLCAFLNPDNIAEEIVTHFFKDQDPLLLDAARRELLKYSLLWRGIGSEKLTIHRLVQVVVRAGMDANTSNDWARRSYHAVDEVIPRIERNITSRYDEDGRFILGQVDYVYVVEFGGRDYLAADHPLRDDSDPRYEDIYI